MPDLLAEKIQSIARQAGSWFDRKDIPLEERESHVASLVEQCVSEAVGEREKEIAAELYERVLVFNNDPRHKDIPDPCVMCAALDAVEEIWKRLGAGKR